MEDYSYGLSQFEDSQFDIYNDLRFWFVYSKGTKVQYQLITPTWFYLKGAQIQIELLLMQAPRKAIPKEVC